MVKHEMSFYQKSLILVYFRSLELENFFNHGEVLNEFLAKILDSGAFAFLQM